MIDQKADLFEVPSGEAGCNIVNVKNDSFQREKRIGCEDSNVGMAVMVAHCKYCQVEPSGKCSCMVHPATIKDNDLKIVSACTQCRERDRYKSSLCKLNRQASGEVDWFTMHKADTNALKEKTFLLNMPCSRGRPDFHEIASPQEKMSLIDFVGDQYRHLHAKITLPPKKRICLSIIMDLSARYVEDPILKLGKEKSIQASIAAGSSTVTSDSMSSTGSIPTRTCLAQDAQEDDRNSTDSISTRICLPRLCRRLQSVRCKPH